jgi:hypothetical protein
MAIRPNQVQRSKALAEGQAAVSTARHNYAVGIHHIGQALVASGYTSLDEQAKALGLNRSTTWTIVKAKHKLGRLSPRQAGA